jgi:hypothetical protein
MQRMQRINATAALVKHLQSIHQRKPKVAAERGQVSRSLNAKAQLARDAKEQERQRGNEMLVAKLHRTHAAVVTARSVPQPSLHAPSARQRRQLRSAASSENKHIGRRLLQTRSHYSRDAWDEHARTPCP